MLSGMRRVAMLARLGVAGLCGGGLVGAAARAKNAVRDVVGTVITPHRSSSSCELARWADVLLIAPATANIIAKVIRWRPSATSNEKRGGTKKKS